MKLKIIIYLTLALLVAAATAWSQTTKNQTASTEATELTLSIIGLENSTGRVRVAIYNSADRFELGGERFMGLVLPIVDQVASARISLPRGTYGIKVFHDENQNEELDTFIFGIPAERYGFSNNPAAKFGPPEFKAAAFTLDSPAQKMTIEVQ